MSSAGHHDLHDMDTIDDNPLLISLPIADRVRSRDFYLAALGFEAIGEPADDGVPEPLLFAPTAGVRLMLVPTVGFGWVIGDHTVAPPGTSECVLGIGAASEAEVATIVDRARRAGATVATEPAPQPWGYAAAFADPDGHVWTVTSARLPG
jgi:predicted lactoylglutathione lyase